MTTKGNDKRNEAMETLANMVESLRTSEGWQRWLEVKSRFHNYSLNNTLMILGQHPEATMVTGYGNKAGTSGWKALGRQVRKGETAIKIFAPMIANKENAEGEKEKRIVGFRLVNVFDISQTDGDPLPENPADEWESIRGEVAGSADALYPILVRAAESLGLSVITEEMTLGGAKGWVYRGETEVHVVTDDPTLMAKTLLHEMFHALDPEIGNNKNRNELIAESGAWLVSQRLGISGDGVDSATYLTAWKADAEAIKEAGTLVCKIAKQIEEAVAKVGALDSVPA